MTEEFTDRVEVPEPPKVTGREIIETIGEVMEKSLEPLFSKTLAPSLYQIYLHEDDFFRLRNVFPIIEQEVSEYLDNELARLNAPTPSTEATSRFSLPFMTPRDEEIRPPKSDRSPVVRTDSNWYIQFQQDPNDKLEPGEVEVVTELAVGQENRYGTGSSTHRITSTTRRLGGMETHQSERVRSKAGDTASQPLARFKYQDDSGNCVYEMTKDHIVIGRKAEDAWVDLDLETRLDVSREHAHVRYTKGAFSIKDVSTYGVTVDGAPIPSSLGADEQQDLELWHPLGDGAEIELASVITLRFEIVPRKDAKE